MKFYNSRDKNHCVNFKQALWQGLAPSGGLYCPEQLPSWSRDEMTELLNCSRHDLATTVLHAYMDDVIERSELSTILHDCLDFEIPLVTIDDQVSILELFHGPTEAFKDVGARFMARMMSHFLGDKKLTILVATSGDTGSAVADGFWKVDGIDVIVLFPKGCVSPFQESQMTTLGDNITAVEVEGTFDDCQDLVKRAFQDESISKVKTLSSANSINIGRLLPQSLYYYFIAQQSDVPADKLTICVPSGNFGNLTSGLYADRSGLNFGQFIAATNSNDTFPNYIESGEYAPKPSVTTLSNAMDVGKPSNFERIMELFNHDHGQVRSAIKSRHVTDDETLATMKKVYETNNYLLDPHAAVAYHAARQLATKSDAHQVILGTAHPRKFERAVNLALPEVKLAYPENTRASHKLSISQDYNQLKSIILD